MTTERSQTSAGKLQESQSQTKQQKTQPQIDPNSKESLPFQPKFPNPNSKKSSRIPNSKKSQTQFQDSAFLGENVGKQLVKHISLQHTYIYTCEKKLWVWKRNKGPTIQKDRLKYCEL